MIKLSKMADHALVLCSHLAASPESSLPATEWARRANLGEPTAMKLLKAMATSGICESKRGKEGGYKLARAPEKVSVLSVVEAIDGPLLFTDCALGAIGCAHSGSCSVKPHAVKIGEAIRESLSALALDQIAHPNIKGVLRHGQ